MRKPDQALLALKMRGPWVVVSGLLQVLQSALSSASSRASLRVPICHQAHRRPPAWSGVPWRATGAIGHWLDSVVGAAAGPEPVPR